MIIEVNGPIHFHSELVNYQRGHGTQIAAEPLWGDLFLSLFGRHRKWMLDTWGPVCPIVWAPPNCDQFQGNVGSQNRSMWFGDFAATNDSPVALSSIVAPVVEFSLGFKHGFV